MKKTTKLRIKPSTKIHRRYLLMKGNKKVIEKSILNYIGILGWAKASPMFVPNKKNNLILAVNRSEIDKIRGAFAICADKIEVLKVSGTLKGLEK